MTLSRKFLTLTGPIWVAAVALSQQAAAQTAPKPPAAAPAAPPAAAAPAPAPKAAPVNNAASAKPAAPAPAAPAAKPAAAPVAAAPAPAAAEPPTTKTEAAGATAPAATMNADANVGTNVAVAAPVALPPPPLPVVEPAPAPPPAAPVEEKSAAVFPTKLAVGNTGWLQIGMLAQGWFVIDDNTRASDTGIYFRVRRAQLKFSGDIVKDTFSYLVLLDGAKTLRFGTANNVLTSAPADTSPLLDFMVTAKSAIADVSIGQWKSPISYEGVSSSAELLMPERAYTSRYFGDNYDLGIRADKKFEYVKYSLQLIQGGNANQQDQNRQKELALRLEFTPTKGVMVGGAGLLSVGQRANQTDGSIKTRDIVEADVAIDMDGLLARGELLWGWQGATSDNAPKRIKSRGMMASLGYTIANKVQPVVRLSYLDVDQPTNGTGAGQPLMGKFGIPSDEIRGYEFGVNYLIDGKFAKIQAAYGYFDLDNAPYRHQFILSGQAAF